jgi:hypothetical protein
MVGWGTAAAFWNPGHGAFMVRGWPPGGGAATGRTAGMVSVAVVSTVLGAETPRSALILSMNPAESNGLAIQASAPARLARSSSNCSKVPESKSTGIERSAGSFFVSSTTS